MAILDRISDLFKRGSGVHVSSYLSHVEFLETDDRDSALGTLVDALVQKGVVSDGQLFYDAVLRREEIVSTGIGMGVAIPHAKLSGFDDFFIAIGIQKKGSGIEWDALDGSPVKLIFLIGGPLDQQTKYLEILSHLTVAIKDKACREALLECTCEKEASKKLYVAH